MGKLAEESLRKVLLSCAGAVDAAELGAELSRAFSAHPFLSTVKGTKTVMRILEVRCAVRAVSQAATL